MVIEALKAARDFIENDRQALAESLTVNGEIVFEDDIDRGAMAEYVNVLVVIDRALEQALAAPVQPVDFETWFSSEERFNDAPKDDYPITYLGMEKLAKDSMRYAWNAAHAAPPAAQQEHEPENEPHVSLASVREDWGPGPHEVHSLPPAQPAPVPMAHIVGEIDHTGKVWKPVQPAPELKPVKFGMNGQKMMFKVGVQQFTLDYEPDTQDEFNFMRDMLVHAFSTFTPDVKTTPTAAQPAVPEGWKLVPVAALKRWRDAFAEELGAWDIDPPIHHVKTSCDEIEAMLAAAPEKGQP